MTRQRDEVEEPPRNVKKRQTWNNVRLNFDSGNMNEILHYS